MRSYQDIASSHSVSTLSKTNIIPQVMVEGRLPPKVKRDAHDVILEFIRSRPPLKPVRREQRALFVMRLEIEPGPDTALGPIPVSRKPKCYPRNLFQYFKLIP